MHPHNELTHQIINAAIAVHDELGPGLLESVYSRCLAIELQERTIAYKREVSLPVIYHGHELGEPYVMDFLVADSVVLELKSVDELKPVHAKQLLTYLRLSQKRTGLLINFNVSMLKDGIQRVVNTGLKG